MTLPTDYDSFRVDPLTPQFGAEVAGLDLGDIDDASLATLHDAWMDWKVLFFRDQDISIEQHIDFGRRLGELEVHPFLADPDHPELVVLDTAGAGPAKANFWHTDVSFRERPPMGSILRGRVIPPTGGDTCWIDMERLYDDLDDELKELIDGRTATHTLSKTFGKMVDAEERERKLAEFPDQHHPVVRTHPVTGRKCLYLNRPFVQCIDDMEHEESRRLLGQLVGLANYSILEQQIRFRWRPNSFAMWDNRCTQHYAIADYDDRRRVERVTLAGDVPV